MVFAIKVEKNQTRLDKSLAIKVITHEIMFLLLYRITNT